MAVESLRRRLAELLGFAVRPVPDLLVRAVRRRDGYVEQVVSYTGDEGDVPALLLSPERPCGVGVVVHHQHHAQWQFGKSEVAGICGDPWQAFGPALARRGVTVITHDALGFEDRRPGPPGTDARKSDATDYFTTMRYRLVRGRPQFAVVSGSACTYRDRIVNGVGIDCAQAIPGLLDYRAHGGHALTEERFNAIIKWVTIAAIRSDFR